MNELSFSNEYDFLEISVDISSYPTLCDIHNGFQLELADDLLPLVEETIIVNNLNSIFELRFVKKWTSR